MGFHWPELLAIGMIALLIFGPRRLPEMGNALGKALGKPVVWLKPVKSAVPGRTTHG